MFPFSELFLTKSNTQLTTAVSLQNPQKYFGFLGEISRTRHQNIFMDLLQSAQLCLSSEREMPRGFVSCFTNAVV